MSDAMLLQTVMQWMSNYQYQIKREIEAGQTLDEQNEMNLGVSDGGQSSPVAPGSESKHLSKRRHVESMDLSECAAMPKI